MEKKFVAQKALLVDPRGQVLFLRLNEERGGVAREHRWDLPGGRMDERETPLETLARELHEELGVPIDVSKATPFFVDLWGVGGDTQGQPVVAMFWIVRVGELDVRISDEHAGHEWFDPRHPTPDDFRRSVMRVQDILEAYREREGIVVASDDGIKGHAGYGLIQLFTGNGKGKTTAALGEVMRAVGAGKRAAVVFFDKGGEHYLERKVLDQLAVEDHERGLGRVEWFAFGRDRIDPSTGRFDFSVTDEDRRLGQEGLMKARTLVESDQYDLLVLDEINSSTDLGITTEAELLALLNSKCGRTEVILTGRNAPKSFIDRAHLVSEMRLRKHYFYSGVKARDGLDY